MIVGGIRLRWLALGGGVAVGGFILVVATGIVSYASDRINVWFNPWSDPQGDGFQTIQSIYAIGSGGLWGRGIGQSRQKYLWVPEPHNDFIFSIVCEELGLIGAVAILAAFAVTCVEGNNHCPPRSRPFRRSPCSGHNLPGGTSGGAQRPCCHRHNSQHRHKPSVFQLRRNGAAHAACANGCAAFNLTAKLGQEKGGIKMNILFGLAEAPAVT